MKIKSCADNGFFVTISDVTADKGGAHKLANGCTADKPDCPQQTVKRESTGDAITAVNDSCAQTINVELKYSDADEQTASCEAGDHARTYTLKVKNTGKTWGAWANDGNAVAGTCYSKGYQPQKRTQTCDTCHAETKTDTQNVDLGYGSHNYAGQPWVDDANGYSHHQDCVNYARCSQVAANNAASRVTHEHIWDQTIVEQYANCTLQGIEYDVCSTCGAKSEKRYPDPLGHDWYWHTETNNGISNGRLWVRCDRPGCDEHNPARDDAKVDSAVTNRYRLVLDKDQHTQSVTQDSKESLATLGALGNTSGINGLNISEYYAVGATAKTQATPNIGYHFDYWSMAAADEQGISWDHNSNPTSFAMPGRAITVKANTAINTSTLVVDPGFVSSYKPECSAYWEGSSDSQSFGPENWHTKKDIPIPARVGYDFTTWTLTSDHPNDGPGTMSTLTGPAVFTYGSDRAATSTDTLTANWTPRTDTKYVIRHWKQNIDYSLGDDQEKYDVLMDDYEKYYKLVDTENLQGESDKVLILSQIAKNYKGFHYIAGTTNVNDGTFVQSAQAVIYPDGVTEINLFYARNRYTVTTSHDGSGEVYTDSDGRNDKRNESNWFQYGDDVTVSYEPDDGWYTKYITVDGVKIERSSLLPYRDAYKFLGLDRNHTVDVTFKIMPHINIVSTFDGKNGGLDEIKQWNPTFIYHVEGMDYLGRHVGYNFITDEWDKILDTRILPGEYTVTSKPVNRWKIRNASVDQFQVGEMSKDFAITVNLIDREDAADGMKAPTSLFTYVYGVDHWNGFSSSDIVVNKLRK